MKAGRRTPPSVEQPSLYLVPELSSLRLSLAFEPPAAACKTDLTGWIVERMRTATDVTPLQFLSEIARGAKSVTLREAALQGLGYLLLGGNPSQYNYTSFPDFHPSTADVAKEIQLDACETSDHRFREASLQLISRAHHDGERLPLLIAALSWKAPSLRTLAIHSFKPDDFVNPLVQAQFEAHPDLKAELQPRYALRHAANQIRAQAEAAARRGRDEAEF